MGALLAALPGFIRALPVIIQLLVKFMNLIERVADYSKKQNLEKWLEEVEENFDKLEKAQTSQDKLAAARGISGLLRKLN